jgi:hypothetical protein
MLSAAQRRRRSIAMVVVIGSLVVGTFLAQDDHFPFGPFRMYSIRNRLDGRIKGGRVEITTAAGRQVQLPINPENFGLRRAEVEGQIDRFIARPELLGALAEAYETFNPDDEVVQLRLYHQIFQLERGRPTDPVEEATIATWDSP